MTKFETMFKTRSNSNESNHARPLRGLELSSLDLEFVSSFVIRISNFRRKGFSFAEVMFAVIVLGIGFIMIAAIFPVAIQQSKATNDETTAAAIAKAQVITLQDVLSDGSLTVASDLPALTPIPAGFGVGSHVFGQVYSLRDPQPVAIPVKNF